MSDNPDMNQELERHIGEDTYVCVGAQRPHRGRDRESPQVDMQVEGRGGPGRKSKQPEPRWP